MQKKIERETEKEEKATSLRQKCVNNPAQQM